MKNITPSSRIILIYRIILLALTLFTIIAGWSISTIESGLPFIWLNSFKYYTMQTNLMVSVWLILAIVLHNKPESLKKITGPLKGAITLFITTTFIFFAILLAPSTNPQDLQRLLILYYTILPRSHS